MKVYFVTTGEYSDYCIEGTFSTEEKAEAFAALSGGRVETAVADLHCEDVWCDRWCSVFDVKTAKIEEMGGRRAELRKRASCKESVEFYDYSCQANPKGRITSTSYISQAEATRIVIQKAHDLGISIEEKPGCVGH